MKLSVYYSSIILHVDFFLFLQGINFNSNRNIVNTLKSHCLLDYAKDQGKQDAVAENLFKSYFEEGHNINSMDVLSKVLFGLILKQCRKYVLEVLNTNEKEIFMISYKSTF